jgi:hypothetical protein
MAEHIHIWDERRRSAPRESCYDSPRRASVRDARPRQHQRSRPAPPPARSDPRREDGERRFSSPGSEPPRPRQEREVVRAREVLSPRPAVSYNALREIRDARVENIDFPALVDRGPVYWDTNRRFSLDSKALLEAVRKSHGRCQRPGSRVGSRYRVASRTDMD